MPGSQMRWTLVIAATAAALLPACSVVVPAERLKQAQTYTERARKLYNMQQKLQALNFSVKPDPGQGETAFVASAVVKGFPVTLNIDMAAPIPARSVSVAGIGMSLDSTAGPFTIGPQYRPQLLTKGLTPDVITEVETTLGTAITAVNSLAG